MGIEDLTQLQIVDGIIGLIYPAVGITVGIIIASKYAKYKSKELLFVGLSLITSVISYLAIGITFIGIVFFDYVLDDTIFFILLIGFNCLGLIFWICAISLLIFTKKIKQIVSVYVIICAGMWIYTLLGRYVYTSWEVYKRVGPMDAEFSPVISLFSLFLLLSLLITGIMFCRECFKSDQLRVVWRGRFILIGLILYLIVVLFIVFNVTNLTLVIISRVILVIRIAFSYLGWLLPERVAKMLIKQEE
ncbi:MAG: hypothetical protein ACFFAN_04730 [Promethearchaeota archaeon]